MSNSGLSSITLELKKQDGLYYCPTDVFLVDHNPVWSPIQVIRRIAAHDPPPLLKRSKQYMPVTRDCMTELEVWMLCLGSPGEQQLDMLPGNVTGIPPGFQYLPFWCIDWKEEAQIQKQAALRLAERTTECKWRYYMDFGFMRASTSTFAQPAKKNDRVVLSYDGFLLYLLITGDMLGCSSLTLRNHPSTSSTCSWPDLGMNTVALLEQTKEVNWLGPLPYLIWSYGHIIMWWNLQG